jgi:hypothetical protein
MVAESGADDPLANGRVTMLGPCARIEGDTGSARAAFLATHPNAAYYADFRDFAFWKLRVEAIRYIGGYGRMSWISQADWQAAEPDPLAASAAGFVAHMNADHADAMVLYSKAFSKAIDITSTTMTHRPLRLRHVGKDPGGTATRSDRVRKPGPHPGGRARHVDRDGEGRKSAARLNGGEAERSFPGSEARSATAAST